MKKRELLVPLWEYLVRHPEELSRVVRNAGARKLGVPLDLLRWLAGKARGPRVPSDLQIEAVPPGIRVSATVALMGAKLRASAIVYVESVCISPERAEVGLRFSEVALSLLEGAASPLAALIQSGALDLTKLGNLLAVMPRRPAFLVQAKDDRALLDLRKLSMLSGDTAERVLGVITPVVTVTGIVSDPEHIDLELSIFGRGVGAAVSALRTEIEELVAKRDFRWFNSSSTRPSRASPD